MVAKGTKTNIKSIGIWIRVSTEDQAQGESPLHHEKRARLYAEARGWHVATLYDLSGVSGKTVMEHPEAKGKTRTPARWERWAPQRGRSPPRQRSERRLRRRPQPSAGRNRNPLDLDRRFMESTFIESRGVK
jgi:hypothetical protein